MGWLRLALGELFFFLWSYFLMANAQVIPTPTETLDQTLRRLKIQLEKAGTFKIVKEKEAFQSRSERRRDKSGRARARRKGNQNA